MGLSGMLLRSRLVWVSLLGTIVLYRGVLALLPTRHVDVPDLLQAGILWLAVGQSLAAWRLYGSLREAPTTAEVAFTRYLIAWTLIESIALYAFLLGFLEGVAEPVDLFFLWTFVLLAILRPRSEHVVAVS